MIVIVVTCQLDPRTHALRVLKNACYVQLSADMSGQSDSLTSEYYISSVATWNVCYLGEKFNWDERLLCCLCCLGRGNLLEE